MPDSGSTNRADLSRNADSDCHDFLDVRDSLSKEPLDTHLERHLGSRAASACSREAHLHRTVFHSHEFNIAAVPLKQRPYLLVDYLLNFFFHFNPNPLRANALSQ